MMDTDNIKNLSWNVSIEEQNKAIEALVLSDTLDAKILLQPLDKNCWENAAKVLFLMGYPRIKTAVQGLFVWLQDKNWPGVLIVTKILELLPRDILCKGLESAAYQAEETKDDIWLYNLSELLIDFKLLESDFESKEVYNELVNAKN